MVLLLLLFGFDRLLELIFEHLNVLLSCIAVLVLGFGDHARMILLLKLQRGDILARFRPATVVLRLREHEVAHLALDQLVADRVVAIEARMVRPADYI